VTQFEESLPDFFRNRETDFHDDNSRQLMTKLATVHCKILFVESRARVRVPKAPSHLWGFIGPSSPLRYFESCLRRRSFDDIVAQL